MFSSISAESRPGGRPHRRANRRAAACVLLTAFTLLLLSTSPAQACPRCFESADGDVVKTYYWTAVFLSTLPLGMIFGIVYTLRRMVRQADRGQRSR